MRRKGKASIPQRLKTFSVSSRHRKEVFISGAGATGTGIATGGLDGSIGGGGAGRGVTISLSEAHEKRKAAAESATDINKKIKEPRFLIKIFCLSKDAESNPDNEIAPDRFSGQALFFIVIS